MPIAPPRSVGAGVIDRFVRANGPVGSAWTPGPNAMVDWRVVGNRLQDLSNLPQAILTRDAGMANFVITADLSSAQYVGILARVPAGASVAGGYLFYSDGSNFVLSGSDSGEVFTNIKTVASPRAGLLTGNHTWRVTCDSAGAYLTVDGTFVMGTNVAYGAAANGFGLWTYNGVTNSTSFGPIEVQPIGRDTSIGTTGLAIPGRGSAIASTRSLTALR